VSLQGEEPIWDIQDSSSAEVLKIPIVYLPSSRHSASALARHSAMIRAASRMLSSVCELIIWNRNLALPLGTPGNSTKFASSRLFANFSRSEMPTSGDLKGKRRLQESTSLPGLLRPWDALFTTYCRSQHRPMTWRCCEIKCGGRLRLSSAPMTDKRCHSWHNCWPACPKRRPNDGFLQTARLIRSRFSPAWRYF